MNLTRLPDRWRQSVIEGRPIKRKAWQEAQHRVGQFWQGLWAHVTPEEKKKVATLLEPQAAALFARMPTDGQRHCLNVLALVQDAGYQQPDLLQAALLHDVGKCAAAEAGVALGLWLRGPLVLLEMFLPDLVTRWAANDPARGWRYLLYVHREHPAIGAEWAAAAGCSPLCCWLIGHHQVPLYELPASTPDDGRRDLLAALKAADMLD